MKSRFNEGGPLMAGTALCLLAVLLLLLTTPVAPQAPLEISFWYGGGGQLEKVIQSQAEQFNKSQPGVKVVPFCVGAYGAGGPMRLTFACRPPRLMGT